MCPLTCEPVGNPLTALPNLEHSNKSKKTGNLVSVWATQAMLAPSQEVEDAATLQGKAKHLISRPSTPCAKHEIRTPPAQTENFLF